jgi:hypothetical protein
MSHRRPRGFATIDVLLAVAAIPAAIAVVDAYWVTCGVSSEQVVTQASVIRGRAQVVLRTTGQCPTVEKLVEWGEIDEWQRDPWGKPFWILCRDGEVTVLSDGSDGKPFTGDDLGDPALAWTPPRPRRRS